MGTTDSGLRHRGRRWAHAHPPLAGLLIFAVLFVPLGIQGVLGEDPNEVVGGFVGAVALSGLWLAAHRWGTTDGPHGASIAVGDREHAPDPTKDERRWAEVCQISILFLPVLVAAGVLISKRDSRFIRSFAAEAMNLQVVLLGTWLLLALAVRTGSTGGSALVVYAIAGAVYLYALAVSAIGTERAARGTSWAYPLNLRVFR